MTSYRRTLLIAAVAAVLALPVTGGTVDQFVRSLSEDGYVFQQISRTWLGRVRIVAYRDGIKREIILSRSTGEVLQDAVFQGEMPRLPAGATPALPTRPNGAAASARGIAAGGTTAATDAARPATGSAKDKSPGKPEKKDASRETETTDRKEKKEKASNGRDK